jgi:phage/plasmid-like protein (TIGR03299 family)
MIDKTTGKAAFVYNSLNGKPWHGDGTAFPGGMTAKKIVEVCAEVAFEVAKVPVEAVVPTPDGPLHVAVPDWNAVIRTDTNAQLGLVRPSYSLFQFTDLTDFLDAVRDESGAEYDTAGSLYNGRIVFAQLDLGDSDKFKVPGDDSPWQRRLLGITGHDGRHAMKAKRVQTRVVCSNTASAAMGEVSPEITVRHTKHMDVNVDEARRALKMVAAYDEAFEQKMIALTKRTLSLDDVLAFTEKLIPTPPEAEQAPRREAARDLIADLFVNSETLVGVPNTSYRLFQATIEYADHFRTYRKKGASPADVRAEAILDGPAAALKDKALALLS